MRISDWSSDVCSSDLLRQIDAELARELARRRPGIRHLAVALRGCWRRDRRGVADLRLHGLRRWRRWRRRFGWLAGVWCTFRCRFRRCHSAEQRADRSALRDLVANLEPETVDNA